MKKKFRILWKTLTYIEEEIWIGLFLFASVAISMGLGCYFPILPATSSTWIVFTYIFNIFAWVLCICVGLGAICLAIYILIGITDAILYVIEDVQESYQMAKDEIAEYEIAKEELKTEKTKEDTE